MMQPTANDDAPIVPDQVAPDEELGRSVFSSRHARRQRISYLVFLESPGNKEISVDRLTYTSTSAAVVIADQIATTRGRNFYGWAVVVANRASANGRSVQSSPLPDGTNPYHADIVLPDLAVANRERQKSHARELADYSHWRARP